MTGGVDRGATRYNETKTRAGGEPRGRRGHEITRPPDIIFPLSATGGIDYVYLSLGTPVEPG